MASRGYQKIIVSGNVGRDPESRQDGNGEDWCSFSVAVNDGYSVKWFSVSTKGALARLCGQYVSSGMQVLVDGVLSGDKDTGGPRVYQKRDGTSGASFEILAREVLFLGKAGEDVRQTEAW